CWRVTENWTALFRRVIHEPARAWLAVPGRSDRDRGVRLVVPARGPGPPGPVRHRGVRVRCGMPVLAGDVAAGYAAGRGLRRMGRYGRGPDSGAVDAVVR